MKVLLEGSQCQGLGPLLPDLDLAPRLARQVLALRVEAPHDAAPVLREVGAHLVVEVHPDAGAFHAAGVAAGVLESRISMTM